MNNDMDLQTAKEQLLSQRKYYQNMADALGVAIANLDATFAPVFKALDDAQTKVSDLQAELDKSK